MVNTELKENIVYIKEKDALNEGLFTQIKVSGNINEYELVTSGVGGVLVGDATTSTKGVVELALDGENAANVVVQGNDSRLGNDRFPTAHAYTHKTAGSDAIRVDELKKGQDVTTLNTTATEHGLAPKLSNNPLHYLDGQGNWNIPPGAGTIPATETTMGIVELASDGETNPSVVVQGNDSRLGNARTPTAHASTHNKDGIDAFVKTDILHAVSRFVETLGSDPTVDVGRLFVNASDLKYWDNTAVTPVKQTVEILSRKNAASGYAGLDGSSKVAPANLPDATTSAKGVAELATDGENAANVVVQGNDSRLSNARTPTAHATSHNAGGGDPIHIDTIGAGTDITTNNVSTTKHGLVKKLDNNAAHFYDGTGNWSTPPDTGEINTASNLAGTAGAVGVFKVKSFLDFQFKKINAGSTKITVTDDTGNDEVDIDVAQANLSLSSIGGTASWSQVSKTGSVVGDIADTTISAPAQYEVLVRNGSGKWVNSKLDNNSIAAAAAIAYSKLNLTGAVLAADIAVAAGIPYSKLNLALGIVNADVSATAAIAKSKLASLDVVNADVNAAAAIAYSKLSLAGSIVNADVAVGAAIAKAKLASLDVVNADVNAAAAIAYSKLNLALGIVNGDISGSAAIAYSKLALGTSIVNADIALAAAIAYSKLALGNSIVNADINTSAAIAWAKISKTGSVLSDIDDVDLTGIATGDSIKWDGGTSSWIVYTPGSSGAPTGAQYITLATDATLTSERVLTAGTNIALVDAGAGSTATLNVPDASTTVKGVAELATSAETAAGLVVQASDTRLSDSRTPALHASSHNSAGGDVVHIDTIGAGTDITTNNSSTTKHGLLKKLSNAATDYMDGTGAWSVPPGTGAPTNAQYVTLATNATLTVERVLTAGTNIALVDAGAGSTATLNVPDGTTTVKGAVELATSGENAANVVVQGNDSRLSDSRTPTAHKDTHKSGGGDAFVKADVLVAPARYVENRADPAADSGAMWINNTSQGIEYWDTQASPAQHELANLDSPQTFSGKTIAAGSNTVTGIVDANIGAHTSTKITITDKTHLNSAILYNDVDNALGAHYHDITKMTAPANPASANDLRLYVDTADTHLKHRNSAGTVVDITAATGGGGDATLAGTQTFTGAKSFDLQISPKEIAAPSSPAANYQALYMDSTSHRLTRKNSGGTVTMLEGIGVAEAKGVATKTGDAATTSFTIAHGLGSTPSWASCEGSSDDARSGFSYTYDATNITVVFPFPPPSTASNLVFNWRVAA